jgi:hypothetical protein
MTRAPKKSETLEIRLSWADKQAFMARCQAQGLTASEALRRAIEEKTRRPGGLGAKGRLAIAALMGAAATAAALPSLARPALAGCLAQPNAAVASLR